MITTTEVLARLVEIADFASGKRKSSSRDASAHAEEDALYEDVLRAVAAGSPDSRELARLALQSLEIKFSRWYE